MRTDTRSKQQQIKEALDHAREVAYQPIAHMNRKERRTKLGRVLQTACEKKLMAATLAVLQASVDLDE